MPLLQKNLETVSNLEDANKINENTATNFQPLPSQAKRIFRKYLKEIKDLSYLVENEDTLGEDLGQLTNIWKLLQGAALKEGGISLEPTKVGFKRKSFSSFALTSGKKKDRNIG